MHWLALDVKYALRSLRRRLAFSAVAIATIALSIGTATAIFSVADAVLFRPLPLRDSGRLVAIWQTEASWKGQPILAQMWDRIRLDYTDFATWRAQQTVFSDVALWTSRNVMLDGTEGTEQVAAARVSPGLFELLDVKPMLGRTFLPGEDVPGGPRVAMLSHEMWTTRFGARRDIVGSLVRFDTTAYEIVGVLPPLFTLERGRPGQELWLPAGQGRGDIGQRNRAFRGIARLKPGVSIEQASAETKRLLIGDDRTGTRGIRITDLVRDETREVRAPMLIVLAAAGLLLLIACVNVATLLVGESAGREMEMRTRAALGATRSRLVRQLLTESVVLAMIGSALGALLALWLTRAIVALAPSRLPGVGTAHVDVRVLGVILAAASVTGIVFGLAPAFTLARAGSATMLRVGQTIPGRGRLQAAMVTTQLALSVVLLGGGGLFVRSLQRLNAVNPGFRSDHLLTIRLGIRSSESADTARLHALYDGVMARLSALPGVSGVTGISTLPFTGASTSTSYVIEGEVASSAVGTHHEVEQRNVAANYFAVMGIPLLAGRAFTDDDRDGAPLVAVLSEAAARRDFPTESPIGRNVKYQGAWWTIVGIVADTKYKKLSMADMPTIYTPFAQRLDDLALILRTRSDPTALTRSVRAAVQATAPTVALTNIDVMDELIRASMGDERFRTTLIAIFGTMAAVLAAVGMYGVTVRAVSRRTREIGIRVALGATSRSVIALIVKQMLVSVAAGFLIGTVAAAMGSRALAPYVFGVTLHDPVTYLGIIVLLGGASMIASWLPARRAGRIAPAIVLKGE